MMLLAVGGGIVGLGALATYYFLPWLKMDLVYIYKFIKLTKDFLGMEKTGTFPVDAFEASVQRDPTKTFLWQDGVSYSYAMVDDEATKVARFAEEIGLKCGDSIAMMILNSPEFVWTFFGFQKLGIQVTLLNTNIRSKSLEHCLDISGAKTVVFGQDLSDVIESVSEFLEENGYSVWIQGSEVPPSYQSMDEITARVPPNPISPGVRSSLRVNDPSIFIFTSGTTGLPKAAILTHKRFCAGMVFAPNLCQATTDDVVYLPMPLYHSSALLIGIGGAARVGCTAVLRKKFSASAFWDDCRRYNVTVFVYIGELLRYLVNRPELPSDKDHKVRTIIGNGLRPEIWKTFSDRFNINQIREFYAATEGLGFFANMCDVPGSIGRCSPIFRKIFPMYFLRFDYESESAYRGPNGRCVQARPGETGLYVCRIEKGLFDFDGYKGKKEMSEKKILRNVFKEGDAFYNSGDLLKVDEMYNVYFMDRVGDTFRWKGENVSTTEVAAVLADEDNISNVNVYGVQVPGCDGRAGMAAMTMNDGCEVTEELLANVYKKVMDYLPAYARPLFLRIQSELETTSTFKYIKTNIQAEGFNPNTIKELLYRLDSTNGTYSPLDTLFYDKVVSGEIRL